MASSQVLGFLALVSSILVLLSPARTLAQSPTAPAPSPSGPVNFTGILAKGGQYNTFIHLLTVETQVATQIQNELNTSSEGLTVFAPTDNAFANLKSGLLNGLSTEKQVELLLYHVVPKYYTITSLVSVSNPVRTQANSYGLNFTGQPNTNQVNVTSTGLIQTQVNNALYQQMPLAVYQVDKVLLPAELFSAPAPANSPPSPASDGSNSTSSAKAPSSSSKNSDSGASRMDLWSGIAVAIGAMCMGTLL